MKPLLFLLSGVIVFNSFSCSDGKQKTADTNEPDQNKILLSRQQFESSGMLLDTLSRQSFPELIKVNGMIDVPPENRAIISAKMGGYIKQTPWLIGDQVNKGQALVVIENPEFVKMQQEYLEVKEQLNYLKSEYERQRVLFEEKISSQKNFLKTQSEYKMAQAKYNGLKKQLQMLNISPEEVAQGTLRALSTIYSPISGSITEVNVSKGTYVSPASSIMEIVDHSHIHLELSVFEKDIFKIKKGQKIDFKIPEASDNIFEAKVHLIGTSINENRSIKVHGHLENETGSNFLTGMFVEASIITAETAHMALPSEAIVAVNESSYVLRLENENKDSYVFKKIEVNTAGTYSNFTGLLDADQFMPADRFLVKGAFNLIIE